PRDFPTSEDAYILTDVLTTLIFPNRPVDQINLYGKSGAVASSGLYNRIANGDPSLLPWYAEVTASPKHQAFLFTAQDPIISKYSTGVYGKQFISFAMQNYDTFNNPYGYIEIKQRLSRVISAAIEYRSVYGEEVYIFDSNGTCLFPLDAQPDASLLALINDPEEQEALSSGAYTDKDRTVLCIPSKRGGFQTVLSIGESQLLQPVRAYTLNILSITVGALIFSLLATYFIARRITAPINALCAQLGEVDLSHAVALSPADSKLTEIETLYDAFYHMQNKLKESVDKQMLLQTQEMQSRMLALQSQMNPHFLFNSLAAIQAMADEGMNREITVMCQSMSRILRYISSDTEQEVSVKDELRHTEDYLLCMATRYQGDLSYTVNVPEQVQQYKLPKLCIQLLAENAIKFTSAKRPPYFISIEGYADDSHFEITITDNGPGFSEETLTLLEKQIATINETGILPSLEIHGMGLLNVYIRYWLLHGDNVIFRFGNRKTGGAYITLGEVFHA
ncbi:MAG: histidine kinase, partial [Eubacteriales bacterium]|nr:histidine kinase [Eubacteriales bacterium]